MKAIVSVAAVTFAVMLAGCGQTPERSVFADRKDAFPVAAERPTRSIPEVESIQIPQNTPIRIRLLHTISSRNATSGASFEAEISQPVKVGETIAFHKGSRVHGRVIRATPSGRLQHPGVLELTLNEAQALNGTWVPLSTNSVSARGKSHRRRNLTLIGGGTGVGAAVGAIFGGGKGAAIGAASGAAAGTGGAYATGRKDVEFGIERALTFRTSKETAVSISAKGPDQVAGNKGSGREE